MICESCLYKNGMIKKYGVKLWLANPFILLEPMARIELATY